MTPAQSSLAHSPDNRAAKPLVHDFAVLCHFPNSREGQTVNTRVEAAKLLAKEVREHREDALD